MPRFSGNHSFGSAFQRFLRLVRGAGLSKTLGLLVSFIDDQHLKLFDRRYGIKTSGYISLSGTSFDPGRLGDATNYGPVNGWALRRLLADLGLPRSLHFVDLGCGLGRACILASEYGFEKVTGVELAADLCEMARKNIAACRRLGPLVAAISIRQMDAMDFCMQSDDDVFFMYRPFTWVFFSKILNALLERAAALGRPIVIIYTERMMHADSYARAFQANPAFRKLREAGTFGQAFFVYECGPKPARPVGGPAAASLSA